MRPGQLTVNELERAILQAIAAQGEVTLPPIARLHVLSREYTGVGSYTTFLRSKQSEEKRTHVTLRARVRIPCVPNGLGAALFLRAGEPEVLECFTYSEHWDGTFDGFKIALD